MSKKLVYSILLAVAVAAGPALSDTLTGVADVNVVDGAIVSITYDGAEYVVADGDLTLGTTTRWYVADGVETLWAEGDPAPAATVSGTSSPKDADVGSNADDFFFAGAGEEGGMSSIDGVDFQETIFPVLSDTFFLFERGGNDAGTWQAILADGTLGPEVAFDKASNGGPYANTGITVGGQDAYGVVFKTDVPVQGVRITASGHDTLSIAAVTPPPMPLVVPMTTVAPAIDGQMDDVWKNIGESRTLITDIANADSAMPEDWYDLFGAFKMAYDANNLYIFVSVQDSVIDYEFSNWNGDGVELFFDGDNSKGDSYDGVNDNQIRITVDDMEPADIDSSLPVEGMSYAVVLTELGYNVEAAFPLDALQIDPNGFGFEVQINDNDGAGGRETMARWHSDNNDSWKDPSLFGLAVLGDRMVSEVLDVVKVGFAPVIDGVMEPGWKDLPQITDNSYSTFDPNNQIDFTDARFSFRMGWDAENLYLYVSVLDDMFYDAATNHTADGIEMFFDADNSKTFEAYDQVDDVQLRINHADLSVADIDISGGSRAPADVTKDNILFAVADTLVGYDVEIAIPLTDLAIPAENGHVFGFDIFLNDADETTRDTVRNYWNDTNDNWKHAHLFGTAELVGGEDEVAPAAE